MARTRLSSKGRVIIPKAVRERYGWRPGIELNVEAVGDAVLLRPARMFPATTVEDVFGCLGHNGPPLTVEQMHAAIAREARRRR